MIDCLLFAVVDQVQAAGYGYDEATCRITPEGRPPADCGEWFASVHQLGSDCGSMNSLDEHLGFAVTLTKRVQVPLDRVGDRELAARLARRRGPNRQPSFNARAEQLKDLLHMGWDTLQAANNNLMEWFADRVVYGFAEPAHYANMDEPRLVGPEWFVASDGQPGSPAVGLVAELRFEGCRRLQPIADYVG